MDDSVKAQLYPLTPAEIAGGVQICAHTTPQFESQKSGLDRVSGLYYRENGNPWFDMKVERLDK